MNRTWNSFLVSFINGVVLLLPITITIALIRFIVKQVNNILLNPLLGFFAPFAKGGQHVYVVKTLIFLAVIACIAFIGWCARILVVNRTFAFGERLLGKVPILGKIYTAVKQISSAFLGHGKTIFKQVVLIEYPRKGVYSIGFTTGTSKGEITQRIGERGVNVFVPTTPNPTSGVFLVVPREGIQFLRMSVEEGMKLIVSGGSISPPFDDGGEEEE